MPNLPALLEACLAARHDFLDSRHEAAFRLFNGFLEGDPNLVIDLYGRTAMLHNYANLPADGAAAIRTAEDFLARALPWVQAVIVKVRAGNPAERRGILLRGGQPDSRIRENGVWYAIQPTMNRDASLYLDTRNLRAWAKASLAGKSVLNTFAYTGSLGVAALAGGAERVTQLDRNREFLTVAKTSYTLNGFKINKGDFLAQDFFPAVAALKRNRQAYDCIFLDAPFFSATEKGRVELEHDTTRLVNKLRPLVKDGGWLVTINNALFLGGEEYLAELQALCADGHLRIESLLPVPEDFTGTPATRRNPPPRDPTPFNHSTKIAILQVLHTLD